MIKLALSFLLGVLLFQTCREIPSFHYLLSVPIFVLCWWKFPQTFYVFVILMGFFWTHCFAYQYYHPRLSSKLINQDVLISGSIDEVSTQSSEYSRFVFKLSKPSFKHLHRQVPKKLLLSWYKPPNEIYAQQGCTLIVRLKKPWGFSNPGSQDYEKNLFLQGVGARGYVREGSCALLETDNHTLSHIRAMWMEDFVEHSSKYTHAALMQALTFAYRKNMQDDQWEVLRKTGTAHLIAISGLHLSAIAFIVFLLVRRCCHLSAWICNRIPARNIAALASILATFFYAYLAGFSIPTQRALVMVLFALSAILLRMPMFSYSVFFTALLLVLIMNPMVVLLAGFWLSFSAVFFIYVALKCTQFIDTTSIINKLIRVVLIQLFLGIALFPISLFYFSEASIIAPLINLIAIPWVSFILLPILLTAQCVFLLGVKNIEWLFQFADGLLAILWSILDIAANLDFAAWQYKPTLLGVICFEVGLITLVQAKGFPTKHFAWLLLPALFLLREPSLKTDQMRLTILDVGQGLALTLETKQHTLLYDAGMRSLSGFNTGQTVVRPYLKWRGINDIDVAIVSHNDNDHAGSMHWLLDNMPIAKLLVSNEPHLYSAKHIELCRQGDSWQWGKVKFDILHPSDKWQSNDNNRSCVLQISHPVGTILLTGDIERLAEDSLIEQYGDNLASDLMTAPHHGSRSSSSHRFIDRVRPQTVVFSAGYMNRYGFPHATITQRYQDAGAQTVETIDQGAVTFLFDPEEGIERLPGHRVIKKRYWHSTLEELIDPIE